MKKSNSEESKRKELAKLFIGYKLKICFVFDVGEPKKPFAKPVLKFITSWLGKGNKPDKWFLFPGEYFIKNDFNRKQAATFTPFIMLRILNKQYSDSNRRFERPADKPLGNMCQVIGSAIKSMLTNQKTMRIGYPMRHTILR